MALVIRAYTADDLAQMTAVWNEIVAEGVAFPQDEPLDTQTAQAFFAAQTLTAVADTPDGIAGLYILHPNNTGRCGHICNASYAVRKDLRGQHIGEQLVADCIRRAPAFGFRILQFNAVVSANAAALHLYRKLGFTQLGTIPGGFRMKDGSYADIIPHYISLV